MNENRFAVFVHSNENARKYSVYCYLFNQEKLIHKKIFLELKLLKKQKYSINKKQIKNMKEDQLNQLLLSFENFYTAR